MLSINFILSHVLVFLIPFAIFAITNASPSPDPYPAVISLPARQSPPSHSGHIAVPSSISTTPDVEHDLLPFVLVSTIDGALHAVDRDGGKVRWTLKEGVDPLVGGGLEGQTVGEDFIVEPLTGGLFVFDEDVEGDAPKIRKLPLSVDQLIDLSPFTFPHSPSRIFTGSKASSLLTLDLRTGQQISCFSSLASNKSDYSDCTCENVLDDLESRSRSNRDVLFVGRTDYRLTIHSPPPSSGATGVSTGGGIQEIVYSTYIPNSYDKPLAEFWAKMGNSDLFEDDGTEHRRVRVELGHDGVAVGVEQGGGVKWVTKLGSVGIAVYDILQPLTPSSANPILVPQPPPHLPSLFPLPAQPHSSHMDVLSKRPSTYIGTVPFSLSLASAMENSTAVSIRKQPLHYALSSSSYPLINFAPPPRPGQLTNGSFLLSDDLPERDQLLPYLLDPPAEEKTIDPPKNETLVAREKPARGWLIWMITVLGLLTACGIGAVGWIRRSRSVNTGTPPATSPVDEKTPLLVKATSEKAVKFAEPTKGIDAQSGSGDDANREDAVDEQETPRKKSGRRRVRGKKKPKDGSINGSSKDDIDAEDEDVKDIGTPSKAEKPLPELPREMSSVDLLEKVEDEHEKEKLVISDCVIGYGSHGTVVLKGEWGSRAVAVKRLLSDFTRLASQEVKLLQASDDHPNVIRYYCQERRDNFLYIALDLCQASLADLIESPDKHMELASALDRKKAMREITKGIEHLHGMKIIHRDIKPQNVLVSKLKDGTLRMLVSDFGLARRLEQDQSSFAPTANNLAGSLGWRAPECIRGQVKLNEPFDEHRSLSSSSTSSSSSSSIHDLMDMSDKEDPERRGRSGKYRLTKAVDLFALGCLYFWILMSGEHPYGEIYDRESNIVKGNICNMGQLDILGEEGHEAGELIGSMLSMDPADRPDTSALLCHPFFWTAAKRLSFLCDASDRFEIMESEPPEPPLVQLEMTAVDVVGKDWFSRADKIFTSNLGKYRKYKGNSVKDLLRAMRNKKHHYQDLEPNAKRHFGALPSGFLFYFTSRYPKLFLHVYDVVKGSRLRHESMFETYFQAGD